MHSTCFNPDVSLRCRPPLSLPINNASYLFDEMFERTPLLISSPNCCSSCCCCYSTANISMCNRLTAINPSFSCKGLTQSTLIQWSLTKRLIFHGNCRRDYANTSRVSSFNLDNSYYYKNLSFKERKKQRQMGYVHKTKKQFLSNVSDNYANDVDVMLSLLTNEVGFERIGVRNRKKINKKHIICEDKKKKKGPERSIDEVVGNIDRQQECVKEQGKILEKKESIKGYYSQDWRKKNEKKLNEALSQHQQNVSSNISEACTEKHNHEFDIFTDQSESRMKNKQFEEMSDEGCGPKGPSDEMWHVTDASDHNISSTSENGDAVKNNERSLWSIVGDVFRFRWASPCSESHIPNSGGGKCSMCLSISSESWFSSREVDDHVNEESGTTESVIPLPSTKKRKGKFDEWEEAYIVESKQRKEDEMFMREAILEAKKAADVGEVPVGAVIVHGGKVIARGYNLVEELRDATAHAEMICIRQASKNLRSWRLLDTTLYVTLEPCPMCAGAILQARIDTVVWGAPNKLLGADGSWISLFNDRNEGENTIPTDKFKPPAPMHPFHQNMAVRRGILAEECAEIMKRFFRSRRNKKTEPESPIPPEPESPIPPSTITVSHHHSNFFSKIQHAFKIIFCL